MYITSRHTQTINHMIIAIHTMKISQKTSTPKKKTPLINRPSEPWAHQFRRYHQIYLQHLKERVREIERIRREEVYQRPREVNQANLSFPFRNILRSVQRRVVDPLRSLICSGLTKPVQRLRGILLDLLPRPPPSEIIELIDDWEPSAATVVATIRAQPETDLFRTRTPISSGYDKEGKYRERRIGYYHPENLLRLTPPYSREEETYLDSDLSTIDQWSCKDSLLSYSKSDVSWDLATPGHQDEDLENQSDLDPSFDHRSYNETQSSRDSDLEDNPRYDPSNPEYDRLHCRCDLYDHQVHRHKLHELCRGDVRNHFQHIEYLQRVNFQESREQVPIWEQPTYHVGSRTFSTSLTN